MNTRLIRRPEVCRLAAISYSTVYRLERQGRFPRRRQLGEHAVGWLLSEVEEWVQTRSLVQVPSLRGETA